MNTYWGLTPVSPTEGQSRHRSRVKALLKAHGKADQDQDQDQAARLRPYFDNNCRPKDGGHLVGFPLSALVSLVRMP